MNTIGRVPVEWLAEKGIAFTSNGALRRAYLRAIKRGDAVEMGPRASKRQPTAGSSYTPPKRCKRRHGRKG